jgi:hypothetical protein
LQFPACLRFFFVLPVVVACSGPHPPADGAARKAAARASLEAVVGAFPTTPAGGEDGRRLFAAIQPLAVDKDERAPLRRLSRAAVSEWTASDRESFASLLAGRRAQLASLHAAAALAPLGLGIPVPPPEGAFPDLRPFLDASRLVALDGREALANGDTPRAARSARTVGLLLQAGYSEPWMVAQLLAGAGERSVDRFLADALASGDAATRDELALALERLDAVPALAWVAGEASLAERTFARSGEKPEAKEIIGLQAAYMDIVVARLYERYAAMAHALDGGWQTFRPWAAEMESLNGEAPRFSDQLLIFTMSPAQRAEHFADVVADTLWSSFVGGIEKAVATRSARQLQRLALDLDRQGRETGSYPENLDLATWRNDYLGESPVYARATDGSARLSLPMTADAWRSDFGADVSPPSLEWQLPAPAAQESKGKLTPAAPPPRS